MPKVVDIGNDGTLTPDHKWPCSCGWSCKPSYLETKIRGWFEAEAFSMRNADIILLLSATCFINFKHFQFTFVHINIRYILP